MLRRPPRPTRFQGSRAFHLLHTLFTTEVPEYTAKVLATVKKKTYPPAEKIPLKLLDWKSDKIVTMTLSRALQLLKPCSYLASAGPGTYRVRTFPEPVSIKVIKRPALSSYKPYTRAGRGKEVYLTTTCTPSYLLHVLSTSYKRILEGTRVEFHLRQNSKDSKDQTVDWALANCMHLRPDSILAAMPEGTIMLAEPAVTDLSFKKKQPKNLQEQLNQVMWVLENPEALERAGERTPKEIKKRARWLDENPLGYGESPGTTPTNP